MSLVMTLLLCVIWLLVGFVLCFFVMKNNPRYFDIDKMLKKMGGEKKAKFIEYLKEKTKLFVLLLCLSFLTHPIAWAAGHCPGIF